MSSARGQSARRTIREADALCRDAFLSILSAPGAHTPRSPRTSDFLLSPLEQAASLKELWLDNAQITELSAGVFDGASSLQLLKLTGNPIVRVDPVAFQRLSALRFTEDAAPRLFWSAGFGANFPMVRLKHAVCNEVCGAPSTAVCGVCVRFD